MGHSDDAQAVAERVDGHGKDLSAAPMANAERRPKVAATQSRKIGGESETDLRRSGDQAPSEDLQSRESSIFALRLNATASEIAPYEPLLVAYSITNLTAVSQPAFPNEQVQILVSFEDRAYRDCEGPRDSIGTYGTASMEPGQTFWYDRLLFYRDNVRRSRAFVFPRPGSYRLKAQVGSHLKSEVVLVHVRERDPAEAEATRLATESAFAKQLQFSRLKPPMAAEDFLHKFPRSLFADHVRLAIARSLVQQADEVRGERSDNLREDAYSYLSGVTDRIAALRARAVFGMARQFKVNPKDSDAYYRLRHELDMLDPSKVYMNADGPFEYLRYLTRANELFYFADRRLDDTVVSETRRLDTFGEFLDVVSQKSLVALECTPSLREHAAPSPASSQNITLRGMMKRMSKNHGYWTKNGDSYFLLECRTTR